MDDELSGGDQVIDDQVSDGVHQLEYSVKMMSEYRSIRICKWYQLKDLTELRIPKCF